VAVQRNAILGIHAMPRTFAAHLRVTLG
jgi:hypothetical protein